MQNSTYETCVAWADPDGVGGVRGSGRPQKYHKKIKGFLAIQVWIPWKITKLPSQHTMLGHHGNASETPFNWTDDGTANPLINLKKNTSRLDPLWQNFLDNKQPCAIKVINSRDWTTVNLSYRAGTLPCALNWLFFIYTKTFWRLFWFAKVTL